MNSAVVDLKGKYLVGQSEKSLFPSAADSEAWRGRLYLLENSCSASFKALLGSSDSG